MKTIYYRTTLLLLVGLGSWSSCQITRPYTGPKSDLTASFRSPQGIPTDTVNTAAMNWTEMFTDPLLQDFIKEGLANNLDLKIALERIIEARADLRLKKSAFYPSLTSNLSIKPHQLPAYQSFGNPRNNTQYDWGLDTNWEIDIWGKLSSSKRAAMAQLLASDAAKRAVQTQLVADIATHYYQLLLLDEQLVITQRTAKNRSEDAESIALLFQNALLNGVAVVQSQASYYEVALDLPDIEQKIKETEHSLCLLLGRTPSGIIRNTLERQQIIYDLKPGIPSQLLANRPDIQVSELHFRIAFEETNMARTHFYPALNITASGGFSSLTLDPWFGSAGLFGSVIGGLSQPLFNKGVNKARLTTAKSRQKQALYQFEKTLLIASREVSNALFELDTAMQKEQTRKKQLAALTQAVAFNKELFLHHQNTNYTDVLTAEQNLLQAALKNLDDQGQKLQATVKLYRALGGGWK
ncbi:efflux transporter outer membrane subunit [Flavobacterium sp. HSC-61S13]|uniref:efflux transporter outer membrane subunit n=1 Tax=Flavobacterium sp. HSC-61S13 TaxID=2910963 RepID=UPI0020A0BA92|nr:efflux transporter outer membrane subunit [Flavobacterium sp. HSC-61S13]MCP1995721.1 NodT family efflux transporter outer membrane factor (OMF) lipoprotein [Flavobacterium sp. HSC-61S13]